MLSGCPTRVVMVVVVVVMLRWWWCRRKMLRKTASLNVFPNGQTSICTCLHIHIQYSIDCFALQ